MPAEVITAIGRLFSRLLTRVEVEFSVSHDEDFGWFAWGATAQSWYPSVVLVNEIRDAA